MARQNLLTSLTDCFDFVFSSIDADPSYYDQLIEPKGYKEACNHPDKVQKDKW
jgi:hypothetical protein